MKLVRHCLGIACASLWSLSAIAGVHSHPPGAVLFMPENDLYLQDHIRDDAQMTEAQFGAIIDNVLAFYTPLATAHGATLTAEKDWTNTEVNAYAEENGTSWIVHMYGGLARRPETTADSFAEVICHELGHHFGGFAFYSDTDWAAAEGEADYFATQSCTRRIWAAQANDTIAEAIPPIAKKNCDAVWQNGGDRNICYRTMIGGVHLAQLLAALGSTTVDITKPDTSVVTATNVDHPEAQCRLDTYVRGAMCTTVFNKDNIPGKANAAGQSSLAAEQDAVTNSCAKDSVGARPACWFFPRI